MDMNLLKLKPLFVFALPMEAANEFIDFDTLFVGVGKVQSIYYLMKKIIDCKPSIIINVGSAGSNEFKPGEVVCCTQFIQRDMNVTPLGFPKYKTPFSNIEPVLNYGIETPYFPIGICGSGDSFEVCGCPDYKVVDMEAYSLAWLSMQEQIPFLCLKYITDGIDDKAAKDWNITVHLAAAALRRSIDVIFNRTWPITI
ncbi:nucleosidase [Niastella vici]|uniref:Nucleosidase n=1 Tax=Niastella vici TaxID=1703345 RepID=A0A1V9G4P4_9BACT|nr:nucleosidase [Niastella vici]OQP65522.1 nucleosidase [Niastella vici]